MRLMDIESYRAIPRKDRCPQMAFRRSRVRSASAPPAKSRVFRLFHPGFIALTPTSFCSGKLSSILAAFFLRSRWIRHRPRPLRQKGLRMLRFLGFHPEPPLLKEIRPGSPFAPVLGAPAGHPGAARLTPSLTPAAPRFARRPVNYVSRAPGNCGIGNSENCRDLVTDLPKNSPEKSEIGN
jgi:hypothetical protein